MQYKTLVLHDPLNAQNKTKVTIHIENFSTCTKDDFILFKTKNHRNAAVERLRGAEKSSSNDQGRSTKTSYSVKFSLFDIQYAIEFILFPKAEQKIEQGLTPELRHQLLKYHLNFQDMGSLLFLANNIIDPLIQGTINKICQHTYETNGGLHYIKTPDGERLRVTNAIQKVFNKLTEFRLSGLYISDFLALYEFVKNALTQEPQVKSLTLFGKRVLSLGQRKDSTKELYAEILELFAHSEINKFYLEELKQNINSSCLIGENPSELIASYLGV